MKLIELLNKRANGEIKEGTKFKFDGLFYTIDDIPMHKDEFKDIFCFDFNVLNEEVEIIEEKPQGRWKPDFKEKYCYIDSSGKVNYHAWDDDDIDKLLYLTKNIFKTEEEAKEYLKYKTALLEAEKPFVKNEINCKLMFSTIDRIALISENYDVMSQGSIYLGQDEDVAQAFLDKWYKQILKYEFGIEE